MDLNDLERTLKALDDRILDHRRQEMEIQEEIDSINLQLERDLAGLHRRDAEWRVKAKSSKMHKVRQLETFRLARHSLGLERTRLLAINYWKRFVHAAYETLPEEEFQRLHKAAQIE